MSMQSLNDQCFCQMKKRILLSKWVPLHCFHICLLNLVVSLHCTPTWILIATIETIKKKHMSSCRDPYQPVVKHPAASPVPAAQTTQDMMPTLVLLGSTQTILQRIGDITGFPVKSTWKSKRDTSNKKQNMSFLFCQQNLHSQCQGQVPKLMSSSGPSKLTASGTSAASTTCKRKAKDNCSNFYEKLKQGHKKLAPKPPGDGKSAVTVVQCQKLCANSSQGQN